MKKIFALLIAVLALACFTGTAFALTAAHQSAATKATQGDCSGCHIPHKAKGAQRLFPNEPGAGTIASFGYMGAMCAEYCHFNVAGVPFANAQTTALKSPGAPGGSHGLTIARIPSQNALPATLPYLTGGGVKDSLGGNLMFECTTCHNTHKDATAGENDLLQMDIDAICDECHIGRGAGDVVWASGYGNSAVPNALGSHPVGTDVTTDTSQHDIDGDLADEPDSPIFIGIGAGAGATAFDKPYGGAAAHNLGGHLIGGVAKDGANHGPMTCQTCHAIHGNQNDSDPPGAVGGPYEDLLAIGQGTHAVANGDPDAGDGNAEASNALCNGCHANQNLAAWAWDPGATLFSHPCDAQLAVNDMGAVVTPNANWPLGNQGGVPLMSIGVICETCHDPHGATTNTHLVRQDGDGPVILLTETTLCDACHTVALGLTCHHPVCNGCMGGRIQSATIGNGDANLTCSDCHNGTGAHNWATAGGIGLDPQWIPFDNGRTLEPACGVASYIANTSRTCFDCHTNALNHFSPTPFNGPVGNIAADIFESRGEGTHLLGGPLVTDLTVGWFNGAVFNAFTGDYNPAANGADGITSCLQNRFGGAAGAFEVACESCHELQARRYTGRAADASGSICYKLLNGQYFETKDEADSNQCTSCHALTPGGGGTHPLTGQTVTKAVDAGRGVTTVITGAGTYANAVGAPNSAEYPATANRVNCDSCHQPHDTETNGATFVMEFYNNVAGLAADPITFATVAIANNTDSTKNIPHTVLCTQCHAY